MREYIFRENGSDLLVAKDRQHLGGREKSDHYQWRFGKMIRHVGESYFTDTECKVLLKHKRLQSH